MSTRQFAQTATARRMEVLAGRPGSEAAGDLLRLYSGFTGARFVVGQEARHVPEIEPVAV